jgi:hypothetical protein
VSAVKAKSPQVDKPKIFAQKSLISPSDDPGVEKYPVLCDVLFPRQKDDIVTWKGGRLSITVEAGYYAVTLTCPSEGKQCSVMSESLTTLFADLEAVLANGQAVWRLTFDAKKELDRKSAK